MPECGDWYKDRLQSVNYDDYAALFWFDRAVRECSSGPVVVEIGGHVGVAHYTFGRVMAYPDTLTWTIVDVPSVTRAGERLATERQATKLRFVNELSDAPSGIDILLASGSLQYLPEPFLPERIQSMRSVPRHILINNTPVTGRGGYFTLQNIGVSTCPYRIHGYDELIRPLLDMGYRLVDRWAKSRAVVIPGRPECKLDEYSGYYLRHERCAS